MGLGHASTTTTFCTIVNGKFAVKSEEGAKGAVSRFSKNKNMDVWEISFPDATGTIIDMRIEDSDYGEQLKLTLKDAADKYVGINIPVKSNYFDAFCGKLQNADLKKQLMLVPFSFEDKMKANKIVSGMNVIQGGKKLDYYYSKTNPRNKPLPPKAQDQMSKEDWIEYFGVVREFFKGVIKDINIVKPTAETNEPVSQENNSANATEVDDLPF